MLRGIGNVDGRVVADTGKDECEPERIVEISIDCGTSGRATEQALTRWVARDGMGTVLDALSAHDASEVRDNLIDGIVTGPLLGEQLVAKRPDVRVLEHAVTRLRERATLPLLAALDRRDELDALWLCDLLTRTGAAGLRIICSTLMERSPKAQRVLLGVLEREGMSPVESDLDQLANVEDGAVRREALRLLIKRPETQLMSVVRAIKDRDEKIVLLGLSSAGTPSAPLFVNALLVRLSHGGEWSDGVRVRAIRALAASGSETAVPWLTQQVLTHHWLWRTERLRKANAETVACIAGLAVHWHAHPRAAAALRLARKSRDSEFVNAVRRAEPT